MLNIVGWIGSILFAVCSSPQAWKSIKHGNSDGVSLSFLLMWLGGEICMIIYVFPMHDLPLLFNYFLNLVFVLIILKYRVFPKN